MTIKEIRKTSLSKYKSHKLNSWSIGIVCGLFCAAVIGLNLLWPFFSIFTVPLLVLPMFFACTIMNAAFEEGVELTVGYFFRSFILFFKRPFNQSFNIIKSFFKSVLLFIVVYFISSNIAHLVYQVIYGDEFLGLMNELMETFYLSIDASGDMINLLYEDGCLLLTYLLFSIEPALYLSIFFFIILVAKESLSSFLYARMPDANPSFVNSTYKKCISMNFSDFYKKFFGLNWPFFLLILLGVVGGIIFVPFDELDPIRNITWGMIFGFGATSFFIPFFLCNNQALFESYDKNFQKASEDVAKDLIARMELFTDFTQEQKEKIRESMTDSFNPLGEESEKENKENNETDHE